MTIHSVRRSCRRWLSEWNTVSVFVRVNRRFRIRNTWRTFRGFWSEQKRKTRQNSCSFRSYFLFFNSSNSNRFALLFVWNNGYRFCDFARIYNNSLSAVFPRENYRENRKMRIEKSVSILLSNTAETRPEFLRTRVRKWFIKLRYVILPEFGRRGFRTRGNVEIRLSDRCRPPVRRYVF